MESTDPSRIDELERKMDEILLATRKAKRYQQVTMWITIVFLVLPLVFMGVVVPMFVNNYVGTLRGGEPAGPSSESQLRQLQELLQ